MNLAREDSSEAVEDYSMVAADAYIPSKYEDSRILRSLKKSYLFQATRIWNHLPVSLRLTTVGKRYGRHLHHLVGLDADREQYFATFFLRNRPELELMCRLLGQRPIGTDLKISVLACSKGAEVYSIMWAIRSMATDLKVQMHAVDISEEIVAFAQRGIYSLNTADTLSTRSDEGTSGQENPTWNTLRDQRASIFERLTPEELNSMCELKQDRATIRPWLREGITWLSGDAGEPELVDNLGPQDIVVANRFLCHMRPAAAEKCLSNITRLVKPGGYLFVSGIDLEVRTKVARAMNWKPVTDLIREIHDGDSSIREGWPLGYWGLEPFCDRRPDWKLRYASVFQVGEAI